MRIVWTERAQLRLQEIHDYIAQDQPQNAQRMVDRLIRRGDQIDQHPYSGREVPEYQREEIREIIEGAYRIIYRILPDCIEVMTVRHGSQMQPSELD